MGNPTNSRRKPGSRNYADYSQEMLAVAVDLVVCKKLSSYEAEKQFGIPRRTILNKCKNLHKKSFGRPTKLSPEEEKHIADAVTLSADFGSPLTLLDLRIIVFNYLEKNNRLHVFNGKMPGDRWVRNFMTRHDFTQRAAQNIKRCRAEKTVPEMIEFYKNLQHSLETIPPSNILNFDETNLSDDPGSKKAIFKRGTKHPERVINSTKTSISIMFAGAANGLCLPPYVVYKADHLWIRWCRDGPPNARYNRTKSGWFDMAMFDDWFESIVLPWATDLNGPKLIIGDNLSSHLSVNTLNLCQENDIKFVFLPRNATHLTQPLDLAFFGPMKKEWRRILLKYKTSNPSICSMNKCHFPQLLNELMDRININDGVNIRSGFKAAGICPFNPSRVTNKLPDVSEKNEKKFDAALLEYLHASRQSKKPKSGTGKNQRLKIIPGKSVTAEEITQISKPVKIKSKNISNTSLHRENHFNIAAAALTEFSITNTNTLQRDSNLKTKTKVTLLSDVKFTKDNFPFINLNNAPLQLTKIDKQTKINHTHSLNQPTEIKSLTRDNDVLTNINNNLINSDKNIVHTINKSKVRKKKLVKRRKKIPVKENQNRKPKRNVTSMQTIPSSTSISDIDMSIHSDSDLFDVNVIPLDEDVHSYNSQLESNEIYDDFTQNEINLSDNCENVLHVSDRVEEKIEQTKKTERRQIIQVQDEEIVTTNVKENQVLLKTNESEEIQRYEACNTNKLDENKENILKKTDSQVTRENSIINSYNIGETILVRYFRYNSWKYYIGVIESIKMNTKPYHYTISFYKTIGKKKGSVKFIMPKRNTDKDIVPEECIVKTIKISQISVNPYCCTLMEDDDITYFS